MNALEISHLHKVYKNNVRALNGINLVVKEGDFFALLGPNGAGKSTTIGILSSLVIKTQGQVNVFDVDLDQDPSRVKSMLGIVPQEFNFAIFDKVIDIVASQAGYYGVPMKEAYQQAEVYLKKLNLYEKRNHAARELSGGMKRRLMIARALVHNPRMLILDEPTAGVDIEIRRSMWDFLRKLNEEGVTIILTTHYLEEAESLCRNIAIINHGDIIKHASTRELINEMEYETYILDLALPLKALFTLQGFDLKLIDEMTLEVTKEKDRSVNELFEILRQQSILVRSMRNKANRLEELFVHLTQKNNEQVK